MGGASLSRAIWWSKIRRLREFAITDISDCRGCACYVDFLRRHGYLAVAKAATPQAGIAATYRLIRDSGPSAPRLKGGDCYDPNASGPVRDPLLRIWAALRRAASWLLIGELAGHGEADPQTTRKFCRALERVGYLAVCVGRGGHKAVRLIRNTGPAAPIPEPGTGRIFDPNLGEFVGGAENGGYPQWLAYQVSQGPQERPALPTDNWPEGSPCPPEISENIRNLLRGNRL